MRHPLISSLLLLLGTAPMAWAQVAPDAVDIDPLLHHVVLENDHVRVFEALASPGAETPMHSHPPFVGVSLSRARLNMTGADGQEFIFDLAPGQVFWLDGIEHSWRLLSGSLHVIAVEPKAAATGRAVAPVDPGARDAVAVDPQTHHVILENDYVRVFEALASPGAHTPMHTHPPFVGVSLAKARLQMAVPEGESFVFDLNPGQVFFLDGVEHSWEMLAGKVHVVAVEIKSAR